MYRYFARCREKGCTFIDTLRDKFIEKGCKFMGTLRENGCQFIGTQQDVEKKGVNA